MMTNLVNKLLLTVSAVGIAWANPRDSVAAAEPRGLGAIVRVEQTFEEEWYGETKPLQGVKLPIAEICGCLVDAACPPAHIKREESRVLVAVTLKGVALGQAYAVFRLGPGGLGGQTGQSVSFSGAAVSGSIVVDHLGKTVRRDFSARKPLPRSVSQTLSATQAPFHEVLFYDDSLVPALVACIDKISGATTVNCAALKQELERLKKDAVASATAGTPKAASASDKPQPSVGAVVQRWDTVAAGLREETLALRDRITKSEEERDKLNSRLAAEKKAHLREVDKRESESQELRKHLDTAQKQLDALTKDLRDAVQRMQALETAGAALREETLAQRAQIARTQKDRDDAFVKYAAAADAHHQTATQFESAMKLNRQLADETAKVKAVLRMFGLKEDPAAYPHMAPDVEGIVLAVGVGGSIIEISIGSDDGLRKGHKLEVYRTGENVGKYIGRVDVVEVAPGRAVCKAIPETLKAPIEVKDRLGSGLRRPNDAGK
jgi:hypothetical protein